MLARKTRRSLDIIESRSHFAISEQPLAQAACSGVHESASCRLICAPWPRRIFTTLKLLSRTAWWRADMPEIQGRNVMSLFISGLYLLQWHLFYIHSLIRSLIWFSWSKIANHDDLDFQDLVLKNCVCVGTKSASNIFGCAVIWGDRFPMLTCS